MRCINLTGGVERFNTITQKNTMGERNHLQFKSFKNYYR